MNQISYTDPVKRDMKQREDDIIYEGFFTYDCGQQIAEELANCRALYHRSGFMQEVSPEHYHITTAFKPQPLHRQWYGVIAEIQIDGYLWDDQIANQETEMISGAEGFQVASIETEEEELQSYLQKLIKKYHITTSYSQWAVDTNYANWSRVQTSTLRMKMVFGGFDVTEQKIVLNQFME